LTNDPRAVAPEFDYSTLHEAPALDDILPEIPLGNETCCRVSDDLVVPHMVDEGRHDLFSREFTRMTRFQSAIQATFFRVWLRSTSLQVVEIPHQEMPMPGILMLHYIPFVQR